MYMKCKTTMSLKWNITLLVLMFIINTDYFPRKQVGFYCRDPKISHPYTGDTVPFRTFLIGSLILPLTVLSLVEIFNFKKDLDIWMNYKRLKKNVTFWYKKCFTHTIILLCVTDVIKLVTNEHRPHFLDVCKPDSNKNCLEGTYVETYECTNTGEYHPLFVRDCSKSFPSGHTSISVFVALYCIHIITTKLSVNRLNFIVKILLILTCLTWASVCSITRFTDKRHHWWDVLFGAALGVCAAALSILLLRRMDPEIQKRNSNSHLDNKKINTKYIS